LRGDIYKKDLFVAGQATGNGRRAIDLNG